MDTPRLNSESKKTLIYYFFAKLTMLFRSTQITHFQDIIVKKLYIFFSFFHEISQTYFDSFGFFFRTK